MIRKITAQKIASYTSDIARGTRALAAAMVRPNVSDADKRQMLAMVQSAMQEVSGVYDSLRAKASSTRDLVAMSNDTNGFEEGLQKIVAIATRLDLMRSALAGDLGVDPEEPVDGVPVEDEEQLPEDYTVSAQELVAELGNPVGASDIPTVNPEDVKTEQANVDGAKTEKSSPDPVVDQKSEPVGQIGLNESEEDYTEDEPTDVPEDEDEGGLDVQFDDDEIPEDALPEGDKPEDETEVPIQASRKAVAKKETLRDSVTARRSVKSNVGKALEGLFNFIGQ